MSRDREFATEVVTRLKGAGFQALWAGGCVRDLILALGAERLRRGDRRDAGSVMGLFRRTVPVGVSFGVVRVLGPEKAGEVEVAHLPERRGVPRRPQARVGDVRGCTDSTPSVGISRSTACSSTR